MLSDRRKIINWLYRRECSPEPVQFDELLIEAAGDALLKPSGVAESFAEANRGRLWNYLLQRIEADLKRGLRPMFVAQSDFPVVDWYVNGIPEGTPRRQRLGLELRARPSLLRWIDGLNSRQYEALACVALERVGADQILLTPSGGEGGIDLFALLRVFGPTHVFSGSNAPIRIVGQCKKYSSPAGVEKIRDFVTTLNQVRFRSPQLPITLPPWFVTARGPVLGWMVGHNGFQGGAEDVARDNGVLVSDSMDLAELLAHPFLFLGQSLAERLASLNQLVNARLISGES